MAYTSYEILPSRVINNRIVPRLWKLKRSDGTFDLFSVSHLQQNCLQYLASKNQAGVFCGRFNSDEVRALGEWSISYNDYSDFNKLFIRVTDNTRYGSVPHVQMRLKLNNDLGMYPYTIQGYNFSDKNAGIRILRVYNGSSWVTKAGGGYNQGNWGSGSNTNRQHATLWSFNLNDLSTIFDYKDYSQIDIAFRAVDGSKYTGSSASLSVNFIHRFTDGHPLYRIYR